MQSANRATSANSIRREGCYTVMVAILSLGWGARAEAASPADPAEALIEQGVRARIQEKPGEALDLFRKAHLLSPTARTLAQMGLAEVALRRWLEAEPHLTAALAAHDAPWIENRRNRKALELALASVRSHIGSVSIVGQAGTEVIVDGKAIGRLPLAGPIRLAEGTTRIEGTMPGHRATAIQIEIVGGVTDTVAMDVGLAVPPPLPQVPIVDDEPQPIQPASSATWKTWTGTALLAASVAGLATGGVWLALDGRRTCAPSAGGQCEWLYDTRTQGWVAIAVGAAAGVAGGFLIWKGHMDATVGVGPGTLEAFGRF